MCGGLGAEEGLARETKLIKRVLMCARVSSSTQLSFSLKRRFNNTRRKVAKKRHAHMRASFCHFAINTVNIGPVCLFDSEDSQFRTRGSDDGKNRVQLVRSLCSYVNELEIFYGSLFID